MEQVALLDDGLAGGEHALAEPVDPGDAAAGLLLEASRSAGRPSPRCRHLVDPDGAGGVAEVGLGAGGQQPAQHLVGGPLHGGDGRDAEPLVDLGAAGVVDAGDDLLDAERLAGDPGRDDVGVVAAGDGGEGVGLLDARPRSRTSWSKPMPVTLVPLNDGPSRRKASGLVSMMATVWLRSSRLRASVEPTRPQPMITTCTAETLHGRHGVGARSLPCSSLRRRGSRRRLQADPARPQAAEHAARRDAAAQADRAAGLRQRRAVVGGLRAGRDLHHAVAWPASRRTPAPGRSRIAVAAGDADRGGVVPAERARLPQRRRRLRGRDGQPRPERRRHGGQRAARRLRADRRGVDLVRRRRTPRPRWPFVSGHEALVRGACWCWCSPR